MDLDKSQSSWISLTSIPPVHYQSAVLILCACLFIWQRGLNTLCADRTMCPFHHFIPLRFLRSQLASSICHYIFRCKAQYLMNTPSHSLSYSFSLPMFIFPNEHGNSKLYIWGMFKMFSILILIIMGEGFGCLTLNFISYQCFISYQ